MPEETERLSEHNDPEVRRQALKDLQRQEKNPLTAVPVFIKSLEDENWRVRKTAVEILLDIDGETVIHDLLQTLYKDNANARNSAIEALIELGPKATDYLINEFKNANVDVKKFIIDIIGSTRDVKAFPLLFKALETEDENIRSSVIEHLSNFKRNATVVDALITLLKSGDVWTAYHAVDALGKIGDVRAAGALLSTLQRKDLRKSAISALGYIADVNTLPSIASFLKDESKTVKEETVKAIAQFFQRGISEEIITENIKDVLGEEALHILSPYIQSGKKEVKTAALLLLGLLKDTGVIAPLLELSVSEEVNEPFIKTLVFIGKAMPGSLVPFFKADDSYQRRIVCKIAGIIGTADFFEPLVDCLKDRDGHVRGNAAQALSKFDNPAVVEYIKPLMFDEYENIQEEAVTALSKLKQWLDLKEIMRGLFDSSSTARRNTAMLLGLLRDERTIEALGNAIKDSDIRVRKAVVEALNVLNNKNALRFLIVALKDESSEIRRISALAIGKLHSREGVEALIPLLHDTNAWVRSAAVEALGEIGSKDTIEPLIQLLSDESGLVKIAVVEALGNFRDEKVKRILLQLLHDKDPEMRCAAAESLVFFEDIMQDIVALLKDREWSVRKKAVDILGKFFRHEGSAYLKKIADMDEDSQVRDAAEGYLCA